MSSRASRGMGMGMEKTGLGVDLLDELLARHRRREHAKCAFSRPLVAFRGRRRAAISEGDRVETCRRGWRREVRSDLELVRPIVSKRW